MARKAAQQPSPVRIEDALSSARKSLILRGGRINLIIDDLKQANPKESAIKSLTIMGTNILNSDLFNELVRNGIFGLKFEIDASIAKVAFKLGNQLGVVVKLDQYGNFHYRPGFGGKNLDSVADLLAFCLSSKALEISLTVPVGRLEDLNI